MKKWLCILCLFLLEPCLWAYQQIHGLPDRKPNLVLVDGKDRFYLAYGKMIYVVGQRIENKIKVINKPHSLNYHYQVNRAGNLRALFSTKRKIKEATKTKPAEWEVRHYIKIYEGRRSRVRELPQRLGIRESKIGRDDRWYLWLHAEPLGIRKLDDYYIDGDKVGRVEYESNRKRNLRPKSGIETERSPSEPNELALSKNGYPLRAKKARSRYQTSMVWDQSEAPHLFYHNRKSRSFVHRFYDPAQNQVVDQVLDQAESGLENLALTQGNEIWTLHYFYRDSFNKGLLATVMGPRGRIKRQFVVDASAKRNSGWDLAGARSSRGRVFLTFVSDQKEQTRHFLILNNLRDIERELAANMKQTGHPLGRGHAQGASREEIAQALVSHRQERASFELYLGAGLQQLTTIITVPLPDEADTPYQPEYQVAGNLLNLFEMEGRVGSTSFGIQATKKLIQEESGAEDKAGNLTHLSGQLGWEKLFFDYDVKFSTRQMSTEIRFQDHSDQIEPFRFQHRFTEYKVALLPLKRHQFGVIYQEYNFYQPVYLYLKPEGELSYQLAGQAFGKLDVSNTMLFYGYSTSDYMTRYETEGSDWYMDGQIHGGFSTATFEETSGNGQGITPRQNTGVFGLQAELGWLLYSRFAALNGAGGFVKLAYRADWAQIGGNNDRPSDADEPSDKDDYIYGYSRREIHHGPLVMINLSF